MTMTKVHGDQEGPESLGLQKLRDASQEGSSLVGKEDVDALSQDVEDLEAMPPYDVCITGGQSHDGAGRPGHIDDLQSHSKGDLVPPPFLPNQ